MLPINGHGYSKCCTSTHCTEKGILHNPGLSCSTNRGNFDLSMHAKGLSGLDYKRSQLLLTSHRLQNQQSWSEPHRADVVL